MAQNLELKCRLTSLDAVRAAAEKLGASGAGTIRQEDTYFKVEEGRLKLRRFDDGQAEMIFYRRPDTKDARWSSYSRVSVRDAGAMLALMTAALGVLTTVRKSRQVYLLGDTRIHCDNVEGAGYFLELEVVEADQERAERTMRRLRDAFGIDPGDIVGGSYADLMAPAAAGGTEERPGAEA